MKTYSDFLSLISSEFYKYLMEHEEAASRIPRGALVVFRVENDKEFNKWNEKTALKNRFKKGIHQVNGYISSQSKRKSIENLVKINKALKKEKCRLL